MSKSIFIMPTVSLFHEILQPKKVRTGIKHRTQAALPLSKPLTDKQIHRLTDKLTKIKAEILLKQ